VRQTTILRAAVFHTPGDAFADRGALWSHADGGLAIADGRIALCGDYCDVAAAYPDAELRDLRGGYLLPGFIDTHVHFPQIRIVGGLGYSLLDWLEQLALPEEARMADVALAARLAKDFVRALAAHGTTTALVFGSHFAGATAALFEAAEAGGLRMFSGLVMADRGLRPELHQTPIGAYQASRALIERFHGRGLLRYAVTPRFALSASEAMLETAGALLNEDGSLLFTTHINENRDEVAEAARLFPWAKDYLAVYERFGLIARGSVLAHNVHGTEDEMRRIAAKRAAVAHCPTSNAALGSGVFCLRRHRERGVKVALGSDVGAGTGFGIPKEALQCYLQQRVAAEPVTLTPAQMLYLATRAGAEALAIEDETGDFTVGKSADLVYLRPPRGSVAELAVAHAMDHAASPEAVLGALLTLTGAESVIETQVAGKTVHG
jgi:guanine deaminase